MSDENKTPLVAVARYTYLHRAYLAKGWLDSMGIANSIIHQGLDYSIHTNVPNGIELLVYEDDLDKAKEILKKMGSVYDKENPNPDGMKLDYKVDKILVPVDFSTNAYNAAKYALHVANKKGAELTLFHTYFNPIISPLTYENTFSFSSSVNEALADIEKNAQESMERFVKQLTGYIAEHDLNHLAIHTDLIGGIAEDTILDYVEEADYNLIIVGNKGRSNSDYWFGSVTSHIISKAHVPVVAVPEDSAYLEGEKSVVYVTSFEKSDFVALHKLINIFMPHTPKLNIKVLHASSKGSKSPYDDDEIQRFEMKIKDEFQDVIDLKFYTEEMDDITTCLDSFIDKHHCDMIAMTTHRRNLITSLFNPSKTKKVLFHTTKPLIVFHA
ncbi:universal stress protein [Halosquirtibacter xylanolyticus]|uniref:universal stress protein n=1 Tax=Halosquirtibacter xylanolyticus TaxID=3374599 RepID=UPI003747E7FA|nr:universal stress protein [Prolixibacteraceae bacterium]